MESEEWMERRNAMLLLSQSIEFYPLVEKTGRATLACVESMVEKETFTDLKTLANSILVKLRSQRDRWVDRDPAKKADDSKKAATSSSKTGSSQAKADSA